MGCRVACVHRDVDVRDGGQTQQTLGRAQAISLAGCLEGIRRRVDAADGAVEHVSGVGRRTSIRDLWFCTQRPGRRAWRTAAGAERRCGKAATRSRVCGAAPRARHESAHPRPRAIRPGNDRIQIELGDLVQSSPRTDSLCRRSSSAPTSALPCPGTRGRAFRLSLRDQLVGVDVRERRDTEGRLPDQLGKDVARPKATSGRTPGPGRPRREAGTAADDEAGPEREGRFSPLPREPPPPTPDRRRRRPFRSCVRRSRALHDCGSPSSIAAETASAAVSATCRQRPDAYTSSSARVCVGSSHASSRSLRAAETIAPAASRSIPSSTGIDPRGGRSHSARAAGSPGLGGNSGYTMFVTPAQRHCRSADERGGHRLLCARRRTAHRVGNILRRGDDRWHEEDDDGVDPWIGEHDWQHLLVTCLCRRAQHVHRVRHARLRREPARVRRQSPARARQLQPAASHASAQRNPRPPAFVRTATRGPAGEAVSRGGPRRRSAPGVRARITPAWWKSASTAASAPAAPRCASSPPALLSRGPALHRQDRLASCDPTHDSPEPARVSEGLRRGRRARAGRPPSTRAGVGRHVRPARRRRTQKGPVALAGLLEQASPSAPLCDEKPIGPATPRGRRSRQGSVAETATPDNWGR